MIARSCIACFLLITSFLAIGQDTALQRLMSLPNDTNKVKAISLYAQKIVHQDPRKAKDVCTQILEISRLIGYNWGIGNGYSYLAYFENSAGNYPKSINYLLEGLTYYRKCNDTAGIAKCYGNLAVCYEALNKNDSGIIYRMMAIALLEKKPTYHLGTQYLNLAVQFNNRLESPDKALYYFRKAAEVAEETKDTVKQIMALSGISHTLLDKKQNREALSAAEESVRLAKLVDNNMAWSYALENYGRVLLEFKRVDEAIKATSEGYRYAVLADYPDGILLNSVTWGMALRQKGHYKQQAIVLERALAKANQINNIQMFQYIYEGLAEANYQLGIYKKAYDYRVQAALYADSNKTARDNRMLADLDAKYQTSEKERTISQNNLVVAQKVVQLQKSKQMTLYSAGSALVALLVALLVFFHFRNKRKMDRRQLLALQQEQEIQLLQAVMQGEEKERSRIAKDLHDGVAGMLAAVKMHFNSIALHIGGVLQTEGYQQGIKLLDEVSHEVRKTSHNLMPEVLLQHGLDEAIRRYCNNVTNSSKLLVQYDVIGEMGRFKDSFELSVYRIVQELLNNIVKHSKASEAIVQISHQDSLLSITIEDNGVGLTDEASQKEGMGLRSLQSRVRAMNGKIQFDSASGQGLNAYLEFETIGLQKAADVQEVL